MMSFAPLYVPTVGVALFCDPLLGLFLSWLRRFWFSCRQYCCRYCWPDQYDSPIRAVSNIYTYTIL